MEIITSNPQLAVFSAGTLLGATSTYFLVNFCKKVGRNGASERKIEATDPNNDYRLILGVRNDLKMQKGKVAAQCGHGAMAAYANAVELQPKTLKRWLRYGQTKIAVRVDSEEELLELDKRAKALNVLSSIVKDAGQTQVAPGSRTVIAIGPAPKVVIDKITGHLKLY